LLASPLSPGDTCGEPHRWRRVCRNVGTPGLRALHGAADYRARHPRCVNKTFTGKQPSLLFEYKTLHGSSSTVATIARSIDAFDRRAVALLDSLSFSTQTSLCCFLMKCGALCIPFPLHCAAYSGRLLSVHQASSFHTGATVDGWEALAEATGGTATERYPHEHSTRMSVEIATKRKFQFQFQFQFSTRLYVATVAVLIQATHMSADAGVLAARHRTHGGRD
jgi:hypothetical protein